MPEVAELRSSPVTMSCCGSGIGSDECSDTRHTGALASGTPWSSTPATGPALRFVPYQVEKYLEAFKTLLAQGVRDFTIQGWAPEVPVFLAKANEFRSQFDFQLRAFGKDLREADLDGLTLRTALPSTGAVLLFLPSGPALSLALMEYQGAEHIILCAPVTEHYFTRRPLLIQSIPKCGTHLLFEVAKAMGYGSPSSLDLPDFAEELLPGYFYNLQHFALEDLGQPYSRIGRFVDAFAASPIPFIYRDPRDAAVSMAHYLAKQKDYHLLTSYMKALTPAERLSAVISGNYPIPVFINRNFSFRGSIRDLMMAYADWFARPFSNVLPIRFEDLVGSAGGGDDQRQWKALWRLQLALHVPGSPADFVQGIYNRKSLTFRKGMIGSYQDEFSEEHYRRFRSLPQDFMQVYGYEDSVGSGHPQAETEATVSPAGYRGEIELDVELAGSPCLLQEGYRGFNIVRFERQFIGVSHELGDIRNWPVPEQNVALWTDEGKWIVGKSCNEVRAAIDDQRIRRLETQLRGLEVSLQRNHDQVDYLREDLLVIHRKLSVRHQLARARRVFEKVVPVTRLWKLFSRSVNKKEPTE